MTLAQPFALSVKDADLNSSKPPKKRKISGMSDVQPKDSLAAVSNWENANDSEPIFKLTKANTVVHDTENRSKAKIKAAAESLPQDHSQTEGKVATEETHSKENKLPEVDSSAPELVAGAPSHSPKQPPKKKKKTKKKAIEKALDSSKDGTFLEPGIEGCIVKAPTAEAQTKLNQTQQIATAEGNPSIMEPIKPKAKKKRKSSGKVHEQEDTNPSQQPGIEACIAKAPSAEDHMQQFATTETHPSAMEPLKSKGQKNKIKWQG